MKIGILTNLYPPLARGGAEVVAQQSAEALVRRGHDVFVVTSRPIARRSPVRDDTPPPDGVRIHRFFPANLYHVGSSQHMALPIRALWHLVDLWTPLWGGRLGRILDAERPAAVISHNLKGLGLRSGRAVQARGMVHVHTLHDVQLCVPSGLLVHGRERPGLIGSTLRAWYERRTRKALGHPDAVVSPSRFLLDFHRARGLFTAPRAEILPNPLRLPPRSDRGSEPRSGTVRFLFAGQLEPHKGVELLLKAWRLGHAAAELHFAGTGSLSRRVADAAHAGDIHYHGWLDRDALHRLLAKTDFVVVPSTVYENAPLVVGEALGCGAGVVAADIGGIPEMLRPDHDGLLFPPGSASGLAASLNRAVGEAAAFRGRRREIAASVANRGADDHAARLEALLVDLLQSRGHASASPA